MGLVEQMKRDDMKLKPLLRLSADDNVGMREGGGDHEEQAREAFDGVAGTPVWGGEAGDIDRYEVQRR